MTLSYHVRSGALVRKGHNTPPPPIDTTRPTGTNYVRYEDVYVAGDNLQDVVNRVTGNKVLTFPEGTFIIPPNFAYGYKDGIRLGGSGGGAGCRGFVGSGRNTIFKMLSSNQSPGVGVSPYMLIDAVSSSADPIITVEFRNFQLQGTDLGHEYHGLRLERCSGIVDNVYINGVTGYDKVPPGETGSLALNKCINLKISNTEIDGRRNGVRVSSSPFLPNNSSYITVEDCYFHHSLTGGGGIAWFTCTDCTVNRVRSEYIGSGLGNLSGYCFNHEQSTRITYNDPVMICDRNASGPANLHISLNSDGARGGTDCVLTINNPTWDATSVGSGKLVIDTWGIAQQMQVSPPIVKDKLGNPLPFTWLHP